MKVGKRMTGRFQARFFVGAALLFAACDTNTSEPQDMMSPDMMPAPDMAAVDPGGPTSCQGPAFTENVSACTPGANDYRPRVNMSMNDTWAACITDDNMIHFLSGMTPSSAARTAAFDSMGVRLWKNPKPLTADDFLNARNDYSVTNGLGSRVARRQDVHFTELPNGNKLGCSDPAIAPSFPERCYGPNVLKPIVDDAFAQGLVGNQPRLQAARMEAALLWFFYLSTLSEIWTSSFDNINDVDSSLAYYNAAQSRATPQGLGKYIQALGPETYDRGFDATLASRCWRDLDKVLPAANTTLYNQALAQNDKALLRGMALILRDRFGQLSCSTGVQQQANLEFVKLMGGFMDRAVRAMDATKADALKVQYTAASAAQVDVAKSQQLLDSLFPCP